jgi:hypothetical protein
MRQVNYYEDKGKPTFELEPRPYFRELYFLG